MGQIERKPVIYLFFTFLITWFGWIFPVYQAQSGNYSGNWIVDNMPYRIAGFAPMIVSLFLLRKYIFKKSFFVGFLFGNLQKIKNYSIVLFLFFLSAFVYIIFGDLSKAIPISGFFINLYAQCIFGGGMEEFGWRGYLQPAFEKHMSVLPAVIAVGVIWACWHLPLWIVSGSYQEGTSFIPYLINTVILAFSLCAVWKLTNSILFCILFHGWSNTLFMCIPLTMSIPFYTARILEGILAAFLCFYFQKNKTTHTT